MFGRGVTKALRDGGGLRGRFCGFLHLGVEGLAGGRVRSGVVPCEPESMDVSVCFDPDIPEELLVVFAVQVVQQERVVCFVLEDSEQPGFVVLKTCLPGLGCEFDCGEEVGQVSLVLRIACVGW